MGGSQSEACWAKAQDSLKRANKKRTGSVARAVESLPSKRSHIHTHTHTPKEVK
jgi:hypothetical protein